jgi:hypothetical protein
MAERQVSVLFPQVPWTCVLFGFLTRFLYRPAEFLRHTLALNALDAAEAELGLEAMISAY